MTWTDDTICLNALCRLIEHIIHGDLHPDSVDLINAAVSISLDKGDDRIRPIAVPEALYKIAGRYLLSHIPVASCFPSIQLGCGISGGSEKAVHSIQAALEKRGPGTIVLNLDSSNAFNTRPLHLIAKAVYACKEASVAWRFFHTMYMKGSKMGVFSKGSLIHAFEFLEGVKQGCPLAAFFYCLSVQAIYEECVKDLDIDAFAISDDFILVGSPSVCFEAFRRFKAHPHAPQLNIPKCRALWPVTKTTHPFYAEFIAGAARLGLTAVHGCMKVLGAPVGLVNTSRTDFCTKVEVSHTRFFDALCHPHMPAQTAMLLLRLSGLPRLSYLSRVVPPSLLLSAARDFDSLVINAAIIISSLPDTNKTRKTLTQPMRFGGLGLRSHVFCSSFAFWSAFALASARIPCFHKDLCKYIATSFNTIKAYGIDPSHKSLSKFFPLELEDLWEIYKKYEPTLSQPAHFH